MIRHAFDILQTGWSDVEDSGSSMMIVTILFTCTILLCVFFVLFKNLQKKPRSTIPGPHKTNPKQGNLVDLADHGSLHEYLTFLHKTYGALTAFWWGEQYVVSIMKPEHFKRVNHLPNRPPELFRLFHPLLSSRSLQYANYSDLKTRRALYDPPFSYSSCHFYYEPLQRIADEFVAKWNNLPENDHIDIIRECVVAACVSVTRSCFDEEQFQNHSIASKFLDCYDKCWDLFERCLTEPFPEKDTTAYEDFENARNGILTVVEDVVETKRMNVRTSSEPNFLETLIEADISSDQILFDSITYMIGGFHTSGNLLAWMTYYLCLYPDIQARVYDELKDVLGDVPVTAEAASQLTYLKQVIDETIRCSILAPWAARFSDEDIEIDGFFIPKKTPIIIALGVSLQNENYFPEPEKFDPERFATDNLKSRPQLAYQPFGFAGKRVCPGYRFAYVEMYVLASTLFRAFKFSLVPGQKPVQKVHGLVTKPSDKIWVTVTKR